MKQWTKEDLILFYYGELDENQAQELGNALTGSSQLKQDYDEICGLLDGVIEQELPEPSEHLNRRIMANIDELKSPALAAPVAKQRPQLAAEKTVNRRLSGYFTPDRWGGLVSSLFAGPAFATASIAIAFVMVGVFYLGRMSAEPIDLMVVAQNDNPAAHDNYAFDEQESRRILLTNVSSHLETGERLLTLVSNSDENSKVDLQSRSQMIEEMIGFNRLYRRSAERSNDGTLVNVLQQMEIVLLELYHTDNGADEGELRGIRSRLDDSDLLFKLKVTNKKINREII